MLLTQCSTCHCQGIDRIRFAELTASSASHPHQFRRHLHNSLTCAQQVALKHSREMPAVLQRPSSLGPLTSPVQSFHVAARSRGHRALCQLPSVLLHCHQGVAPLWAFAAKCPHLPVFFSCASTTRL